MPQISAVVLAAGSGTRFGGDKVLEQLQGKPLWKHSFDTLLSSEHIESVGIVCSRSNIEAIRPLAAGAAFLVVGGENRQESARIGCEQANTEWVALHDAARPYIPEEVLSALVNACEGVAGVAPAISASDTVRIRPELNLVARADVVLMQTPQVVHRRSFLSALAERPGNYTDDLAVLQAAGLPVTVVPGSQRLAKITYRDDLHSPKTNMEVRTGLGYDIHACSADPARELWLGGVLFSGETGLEGHSDADVVLHAVVDAILGAAVMGDIGQHFPNTDPRWKGKSSDHFLQHAESLVTQAGWQIKHIDVAIQAEKPKVMPRSGEMRKRIGQIVGLDEGCVSIKATTNERLDAIGRGEGIAAFAIATLQKY